MLPANHVLGEVRKDGGMQQRRLGSSGFTVGAIGLGCMGMSSAYGAAEERNDERSIAVINRALDLGCTLIDTADIYGPFINEQLVGAALKSRRTEAIVATKCGLVPVDPGTGRVHQDGRPMHIKMACDASLHRLGIDVIDLYQLHRPDPTVPVSESLGAMGELVAAGKVRAVGVSEFSLAQLKEAHTAFPFATLQSELSIWTRDALAEILPWCAANDVAFIPFSPLGRGYLTGALADAATNGFAKGDFRSRNPRFSKEALAANQSIVDGIASVANDIGCTPGQVAIAWTMTHGAMVVPIPGTKRMDYLEQNLAAANVVLTEAQLVTLASLPPASAPRY
jgi:aryl-alcohol dehydrogenase-like predicted oxidoreductase